MIQHADDQISDGSVLAGEPHEVAGYPIGNAIESYQGYATVEVFMERGDYSTDGFTAIVDTDGSGLQLLYSERLCEQLKIVTWDPLRTELVHLVFRLRAAMGSVRHKDVDQYVFTVFHSECGVLGS